MIGVFVVDDHDLLRDGFKIMLDAAPDCDLVGDSRTAEEAISQIMAAPPDVVVMDLVMPGLSGTDAIRSLRAALPDLPILALTSFSEPALLEDAMGAGATSLLMKATSRDDLLRAIRLTCTGVSILAPEARVQAAARSERRVTVGSLTSREVEVVVLVAEGRTNAEICRSLGLRLSTVKNHVSRIMEKTGSSSRTEAAVFWLRSSGET